MKHTVHAHRHTYSTDTWIKSQDIAVFSPRAPYPLSQIYFIINQLVAHLPACCIFFSINKALIAFSLQCDLAHCVLSFWWCRPWRTRLDYCTSDPSTGCYQTHALSQRHAPVTRPQNTNKALQEKGDTNSPSNAHNNYIRRQWLKKKKLSISQVQAEEERRWTWGQSGRKVEIWGQIRPPASSQTE